MILGNDLLGQALRCVRGIEISDGSLNIDSMKAVVLGGPEHFLGEKETLKLSQTEYVYPALADRSSPKEWMENGQPDLIERAILKKIEILSQSEAPYIEPVTVQKIRAAYNIFV